MRPHFRLPGLPPRDAPAGAPAIELRAASASDVHARWSGDGETVWETKFGEARYALTRGRAGDHLIEYAGVVAFHLSPEGLDLACVDPATQTADWERTLLDTVLWSVALLHGGQLMHASAVESPGGAVALIAAQGAGKSTLAAQLASEGWPLVTDDILAFERRGEQIVAHPGPNLMNLAPAVTDGVSPESLGTVLASFPDGASTESWVLVRHYSQGELPLAAVMLLRRSAGGAPRVARAESAAIDVIAHTLAFRSIPGAMRRRFDAVGDLVERVPVFCVEGGADATPAEFAGILRANLPQSSASEDHQR